MSYTGEVNYRLDLVDHNDNIVATFAGFGYGTPFRGGLHSFSYRKRLGTSSNAIAVRIWGDDERINDFLRLDEGYDMRWRVFRTDPLWDGAERKDFVGLHRGEEDDQLQSGEFLYTSFGTGLNDFMQSEFIDYHSGSSQVQKQMDASIAAYEYVNENIGPGAGNDDLGLSRVRPRLVVEYPPLCGRIWSGGRAYKLLSDVLLELGEFAPADYGIREETLPTGSSNLANFVWKWRTPRWGSDRTLDNTEGNLPLVFSAETGTVQEYKGNFSHLDEINVVTAVGQGVGSSRRRAMTFRNSTIGLSPWARRAVVRDLKSSEDAELLVRAEEYLLQNAPLKKVKFEVLQNEITRYGRDWDIGDLVHVENRGRRATMKIVGVTVTVRKEGNEKITPEFRAEWFDFT